MLGKALMALAQCYLQLGRIVGGHLPTKKKLTASEPRAFPQPALRRKALRRNRPYRSKTGNSGIPPTLPVGNAAPGRGIHRVAIPALVTSFPGRVTIQSFPGPVTIQNGN